MAGVQVVFPMGLFPLGVAFFQYGASRLRRWHFLSRVERTRIATLSRGTALVAGTVTATEAPDGDERLYLSDDTGTAVVDLAGASVAGGDENQPQRPDEVFAVGHASETTDPDADYELGRAHVLDDCYVVEEQNTDPRAAANAVRGAVGLTVGVVAVVVAGWLALGIV
ncbi:hypothetical protein [Haloarchaeobius sp. DT45]|uniref:hypothetical protein n=1 Tax=Haloarchaeobius sp. DT45 TaxID=3446116 RepID=UPI003F6A8E5B